MNYLHELQIALSKIDPSPLLAFVQGCQGTLWLAGNGGSASTAQHWACDLSKAANKRVQALGSNPAVLTAWANDENYDQALAKELATLARPNDALIVLSCSGRSSNVWNAMHWAHDHDLPCAIVSSDLLPKSGGVLVVKVAHTHYGIIEDCHLAIGHWLTEALCNR